MMRNLFYVFILVSLSLNTMSQNYNNPIVDENLVFEEVAGQLSVEAEYFYKQSKSEKRQWYLTSKKEASDLGHDVDQQHCFGASNNAYLEILPDTRVTHEDVITDGDNFSGEPGKMAILHYKVNINLPGRYYVWVRAYSSGSEDNGLHVGVDGVWPNSGARMQWCEGKNTWHWESKQRTEDEHCGVPYLIYLDIDNAGEHEILFSMREDGFEFDKFILTNTKDYIPKGVGPEVKVKTGILPKPFPNVEN